MYRLDFGRPFFTHDFYSRYNLSHLKRECENVIVEGITVENVVSLYATSDTYGCNKLHNACLLFIARHPYLVYNCGEDIFYLTYHMQVIKTQDFKSLPNNLILEVVEIVSNKQ